MREGYELAECAGENPELFFPERLPEDTEKDYQVAVLVGVGICRRCPIRVKCLGDNLWEPWGIYGGLTARQRRSYRERHGLRRTPEQLARDLAWRRQLDELAVVNVRSAEESTERPVCLSTVPA